MFRQDYSAKNEPQLLQTSSEAARNGKKLSLNRDCCDRDSEDRTRDEPAKASAFIEALYQIKKERTLEAHVFKSLCNFSSQRL